MATTATTNTATDPRIAVCGAGALGGTLVEHLLRMGWRQLRVVDDDRVAAHNTANQPYLLRQVGMAKVQALAELVYEATECEIESICQRIEASNADRILRNCALVVDALDNAAGRVVVRDACQRLGLPCLHVGLSSDGYADLRCNDGYQIRDVTGVDTCQHGYTRNLVVLAVALASEAIGRWQQGASLCNRELPLEALWQATVVPWSTSGR